MIEVKELVYQYPGTKAPTIKGMDFTVQKGEIVGLLGPSGAGKSTVQRIIIGILKNYQGTVRVMGQEVRQLNESFYERIGVSFELPNLYAKFTALENLQFFSSLYAGETEDPQLLLRMVGLEDYAHQKTEGFSKGMKMRLNFARAFLNKPTLVFLDEPTSGLDPVNAKNIKDILLQKKEEGMTIFLTTHNMNVAEELCDRVAFVVDGHIRLIDSPRELMLRFGQKRLTVEYKQDTQVRRMEFDLHGIGRNKEFQQLLITHEIERIYTQEASLQDIFISVTGRSLV